MWVTPLEFIRLHHLTADDCEEINSTYVTIDKVLISCIGSLDHEGRPEIRVDLGQGLVKPAIKFVLTQRLLVLGWVATFSEHRNQTLLILTVKT